MIFKIKNMKRKSINWMLTILMIVLIVVCIDINFSSSKNTRITKNELIIIDLLTGAFIIFFISAALLKRRKKKL